MRKDLEARLLASVRTVEQWENIKENFTEDDWKYYKQLYKYIDTVVNKTGRLPRLVDLKDMFSLPSSVTRQEGEFELLFSEAVSAKVSKYIQETFDKAVTEYAAQPHAMVSYLVSELSKWHRKHGGYSSSVTDNSLYDRLKRYEQLAKENEERGLARVGIKTGISYFDETEGIGWLPGELIGVVGRVYIGKSWLLIYFGIQAWLEGKTILFISPEMSIDEIEVRWDAIYFALQGIQMNLSELYRGLYPTPKMYEIAANVQDSRWFTYTSYLNRSISLPAVAQLIDQHSPDLVIIDGLSLVSVDDSSSQVWEQIKTLSYGFKNLAMLKNTPIIISHQATRSAHNTGKPPALHEIAYGDAFAQACDRVLALSRPTDPNKEKVIRITVQKFRKGRQETSGTDLLIDPESARIEELKGSPTVVEDDMPLRIEDEFGYKGDLMA